MEHILSMKYIITALVVAVIIVIGVYILATGVLSRKQIVDHTPVAHTDTSPRVQIGATIIPVEIAKGATAVQKGLSGRLSLASDTGMFFIFKNPGIYSFWMPQMHFPIDIIWIADGRVVGIEHEVSNEFNPLHPRTYTPPEPVKYVLEVNAGFANAKGIQIGDAVTLLGFVY